MKWEYKVISLSKRLADFGKQTSAKKRNKVLERIDKALDFWGEAGWELVSIEKGMAYFKRPINSNIHSEWWADRDLSLKVTPINNPTYATNEIEEEWGAGHMLKKKDGRQEE